MLSFSWSLSVFLCFVFTALVVTLSVVASSFNIFHFIRILSPLHVNMCVCVCVRNSKIKCTQTEWRKGETTLLYMTVNNSCLHWSEIKLVQMNSMIKMNTISKLCICFFLIIIYYFMHKNTKSVKLMYLFVTFYFTRFGKQCLSQDQCCLIQSHSVSHSEECILFTPNHQRC